MFKVCANNCQGRTRTSPSPAFAPAAGMAAVPSSHVPTQLGEPRGRQGWAPPCYSLKQKRESGMDQHFPWLGQTLRSFKGRHLLPRRVSCRLQGITGGSLGPDSPWQAHAGGRSSGVLGTRAHGIVPGGCPSSVMMGGQQLGDGVETQTRPSRLVPSWSFWVCGPGSGRGWRLRALVVVWPGT